MGGYRDALMGVEDPEDGEDYLRAFHPEDLSRYQRFFVRHPILVGYFWLGVMLSFFGFIIFLAILEDKK
ncbi:MAG: hypothetical protein ACTSU2_15800 [Promethearchaeota archaeon]